MSSSGPRSQPRAHAHGCAGACRRAVRRFRLGVVTNLRGKLTRMIEISTCTTFVTRPHRLKSPVVTRAAVRRSIDDEMARDSREHERTRVWCPAVVERRFDATAASARCPARVATPTRPAWCRPRGAGAALTAAPLSPGSATRHSTAAPKAQSGGVVDAARSGGVTCALTPRFAGSYAFLLSSLAQVRPRAALGGAAIRLNVASASPPRH
jgi:hypothetical protein